jgi:hypothetical protein
MIYFKALSRHSPERTEENHVNGSQNYQYPFRISNRTSPEYKSETFSPGTNLLVECTKEQQYVVRIRLQGDVKDSEIFRRASL